MEGQGRRRIRATVHFDGSDFHGWQVQPTERTVQGEIEARLERLFADPVRLDAAGRTDRGVHAVAQEVAFAVPDGWKPDELHRALNAVLPEDVWVERIRWAPDGFHPRFDATARRYVYLIGVREDAASPLRRRRIWQLCRRPDRVRLEALSSELKGSRDFAGLAKSGSGERGTRCRVEAAVWSRNHAGDLVFTVVADRFLHHMVRYMVATQVEVALGHRPADSLERLLAGEDPSEGDGPRPPAPAPPCGLYLTGVRYADGWNHGGRIPGLAGAARSGGSP